MGYDRNFEGRQYFQMVEHFNPNTNVKWIKVIDATGSLWALCCSYKKAKEAIDILWVKYSKDLKERGKIVKK